MKRPNFFRRAWAKLTGKPARLRLRYEYRENDLFLISYPRSGNTWMRAIMAEMLYGASGQSLKDLQYYVPDTHDYIFRDNLVESDFHVIKSHFPFLYESESVFYKRVVYIIRDPRDVILSYYKFVKKLRSYPFEFEQFVPDFFEGRIWPCSWQEHAFSWLNSGPQARGIQLHVIRYEDLLSEPAQELQKMVDFFAISASSADIERAIQKTTLDEMRQKESQGAVPGASAAGFNFIGKGRANQWHEQLTPAQLALVEKYAGDLLQRYGYPSQSGQA